jgi:hypothetical protein
MKTIVTGVKFIVAWLGKWLGKRLLAAWKARKAAAKVLAKGTPGLLGPVKKDGTPDMRYAANKTQKTGLKGVTDTKDTAGLAKKGRAPGVGPLATKPAVAAAAVGAGAGAAKGSGKMGIRSMKRTMRRLTRAIKRLSRGVKKLIKLLLVGMFGPAILGALSKAAKKFAIVVANFIKKAMLMLYKGFLWAAAALWTLAKRFMVVIGQFLAAAYAFIVGTLLPAIVAFLANPMTWIVIGIIALLILIAVAWYFLITYMMDNWETVKVKMAMAVDRLKLMGQKIANWFSDAAADIGYKIRAIIARIKDGIAWIANSIIDGLISKLPLGASGPGGRILTAMKMKGGHVAKVEAGRTDDLAAREARDAKLDADFEAHYDEKGKKIEAAKILDSERRAGKTAEGGQSTTITTVNTDNREVALHTEGTGPTDSQTLVAIHTGQ